MPRGQVPIEMVGEKEEEISTLDEGIEITSSALFKKECDPGLLPLEGASELFKVGSCGLTECGPAPRIFLQE